jgi:hypothetical protein
LYTDLSPFSVPGWTNVVGIRTRPPGDAVRLVNWRLCPDDRALGNNGPCRIRPPLHRGPRKAAKGVS